MSFREQLTLFVCFILGTNQLNKDFKEPEAIFRIPAMKQSVPSWNGRRVLNVACSCIKVVFP